MATKISYNAMSLPLGELLGAPGNQVDLPDDQGHIQVQVLLDGYAILPSNDISREAFPWIYGPVMAELYAGSVPKGLFLAGADAVTYVPAAQVLKAKEAGADAFVLLPAAGLTRASFYFSAGRRLELLAPDDPQAKEDSRHHERCWTATFYEGDGSAIHSWLVSRPGASFSSIDLELGGRLHNLHSSSNVDRLHPVTREWIRSFWRIYKSRSATQLWELSATLSDRGQEIDVFHYLEEFLGLAIVDHKPGGLLKVVPPDGWRREVLGSCVEHYCNIYAARGEHVLEQKCDRIPTGHDVYLSVHHDR